MCCKCLHLCLRCSFAGMFQTINCQATFHQASIPKTSSKSDSGFIFFHGLVVFCMLQPISWDQHCRYSNQEISHHEIEMLCSRWPITGSDGVSFKNYFSWVIITVCFVTVMEVTKLARKLLLLPLTPHRRLLKTLLQRTNLRDQVHPVHRAFSLQLDLREWQLRFSWSFWQPVWRCGFLCSERNLRNLWMKRPITAVVARGWNPSFPLQKVSLLTVGIS